jgi:ribonuclease Z
MANEFSRRDVLKLTGAGLGSLVVTTTGVTHAAWDPANPPKGLTEVNTLFKSLKPFRVGESLAADEMRVSFMGTISPATERKAQVTSSVFVELGCGESFVFDAGMGCQINYTALQVASSKMRKIFLTHLHGDHTSDLTYMYCFGAQRDAKSPMYLWGPSKSCVPNPWGNGKHEDYEEPEYFDDGMKAFAYHFREMNRWHTESQMFVGTRWVGAEGDGYDLVATELNWATGEKALPWSNNTRLNGDVDGYFPWYSNEPWVAYDDKAKGIRISWFPAVHDRNGSVSYLLEWNGLSMIFSGDTRPNYFMLNKLKQSPKPVDLLIHEMVIPADLWAAIASGGTASPLAIKTSRAVQQNSHTPELALGYMLQQANLVGRAPRLAVATHFQATDSTIRPAFDAVRKWYTGPFSIVTDLEVINISSSVIRKRGGVVSDYADSPPPADPRVKNGVFPPKYNDPRGLPANQVTDPNAPYYPLGLGPLEQFSPCMSDQIIDPCLYDRFGWECTVGYGAYDPPDDPEGCAPDPMR